MKIRDENLKMATYTVINYSDAVLQTNEKTKKHIPIAPALNNNNTFSSSILLTNEAKRKGRVKDGVRMTQPAPIAVARRNARERNRVKQVNNGFAILRSHIPSAISQDAENGRNKKLSKVETLRMAVEYIRRLEDLLSLSGSSENEENESISSFSSYPMVSTPVQQMEFQIKEELDHSPSKKHSFEFYDDEDNLHQDIADIDEDILSETNLIDSTVDLSGRNINFMSSINSTGSISPELVSEHSLSPKTMDSHEPKTIYLQQMNPENFSLKYSVLTNAQLADENTLIQVANWWQQEQLKSVNS